MQVFVFHGAGSRFANAVFSTRLSAETWSSRHGPNGLLTKYEIDAPAFDRQASDGSLPKTIRESLVRGEATTSFAQQYADGARHAHYFHGLGEDSTDFFDALERWQREQGEPSS